VKWKYTTAQSHLFGNYLIAGLELESHFQLSFEARIFRGVPVCGWLGDERRRGYLKGGCCRRSSQPPPVFLAWLELTADLCEFSLSSSLRLCFQVG